GRVRGKSDGNLGLPEWRETGSDSARQAGGDGYIESFNGRLRDECLNGEIFFGVTDAREKLERWRRDYNERRPHSSLDDRTPAEFANVVGQRSFTLPIVPKAGPQPCQGSAAAGRKPPALDRVAV